VRDADVIAELVPACVRRAQPVERHFERLLERRHAMRIAQAVDLCRVQQRGRERKCSRIEWH
jgi:hypothetical protein